MPLYEYQCQACGHRFEVIQKFSDAPIAVCPKCEGAVEKLVSSPAIQFKGSGFYLTDYGRGGNSDTAPGKTGTTEAAEKSGKAGKADAGKTDTAASSGGSDGAAKAPESKPAAPASSAAKAD